MIDATGSPAPGRELAAPGQRPGRASSRIQTREIVASII